MTRGVSNLIERGLLDPLPYIHRHLAGDWGDLCIEDWRANNEALARGERLFSSYYLICSRLKLWIITEGDRSMTTLLLPNEY